MTVEHDRERHHADAQRNERKQEADAAAGDDQPPALRRGQDAGGEIGHVGRGLVAESGGVDCLRGHDPDHEQRQQHGAEPEHRAERGRVEYVHRVPGCSRLSVLTPAAHLIEAEGCEGAEQGKARGQREQ